MGKDEKIQGLTVEQLEAEAAKAAELLKKINEEKGKRADAARAALDKNMSKIKEILQKSGVSGRVVFEVADSGITYKIGKARKGSGSKKTNGNGHLTKEVKEKLDSALANGKSKPTNHKDGFKVGDIEVSATQLGEYAIISGCGASAGEIRKMFPMLTVGQCNGITYRWKNGVESQVKSELGL